MMLPAQVTIVPLYVLFSKLHLVGSLAPLIIPNWFGDAFSIFLLRQFFLTIPEEYADAARVDGCGELRMMLSVVARLAKPAIAAVALFSFLYAGTTSSGPCSTRARTRAHWTLSVGLAQFRTHLPGAVEPHDGGDAAVHAAGDRAVLRRPEGVRRGRHADGGEGMKVAVDRRRLDLHARARLGARARARAARVTRARPADIDAERREVVGGLARTDARAQGFAGGWRSPTSSTGRSTARTWC